MVIGSVVRRQVTGIAATLPDRRKERCSIPGDSSDEPIFLRRGHLPWTGRSAVPTSAPKTCNYISLFFKGLRTALEKRRHCPGGSYGGGAIL